MPTIVSLLFCGLVLCVLAFAVLVWLKLIKSIDALVKFEYENYRHQWECDGQPGGFSWQPPARTGNWLKRFFLGYSGVLLVNRMVFITPAWVKTDTETARRLRKYRQFMLLWILTILLLFVAILLPTFIYALAIRMNS